MYRIYGYGTKGYMNIDRVEKETMMFSILDNLIYSNAYMYYMIIKEENNTDNILAVIYNQEEYEQLKGELINVKTKTLKGR